MKESKLVGDIKYSLDLYSLTYLETQDEISEGMAVITELGKVFRHLHVELKSQLGNDYEDKFPHYADINDTVTKYLRAAMEKRRGLKASSHDLDKNEETYRIPVEADILQTKVDSVNEEVDFYVVKDNGIDKYVSKMEQFVDDFFSLITKLRLSGVDIDVIGPRLAHRSIHGRRTVAPDDIWFKSAWGFPVVPKLFNRFETHLFSRNITFSKSDKGKATFQT